jgi:hypothetical protein
MLQRILWFWVISLRAEKRKILWKFTAFLWMEKSQILAILVAIVCHKESKDPFISKVSI